MAMTQVAGSNNKPLLIIGSQTHLSSCTKTSSKQAKKQQQLLLQQYQSMSSSSQNPTLV